MGKCYNISAAPTADPAARAAGNKRTCAMKNPIPKPFSDLPLWPAAKPDDLPFARPNAASLVEHLMDETDGIERLTDVSTPTLTLFPATSLDNEPRPAVLVCPGGGYGILAWNHEGRDIAMWLAQLGYSAFLLKYRCPDCRDAALADAARAMRTIRANADAFGIDPARVGIIGFSAGAHLAARLSCLPEGKAPYAPADAIDDQPCRPDFQIIIYPAYIYRENWGCDPDFEIGEKTPPAFIMQAENDYWTKSSVAYYIALSEQKVPAELHVFPSGGRGGHGYGLVRTGEPTDDWTDLAARWLARLK